MPRPLDPVSLQHYVAVCEEGNIARAAARECLVPSALSKRLAALEVGRLDMVRGFLGSGGNDAPQLGDPGIGSHLVGRDGVRVALGNHRAFLAEGPGAAEPLVRSRVFAQEY